MLAEQMIDRKQTMMKQGLMIKRSLMKLSLALGRRTLRSRAFPESP
jgi:hypothetical protein